MYSWLEDVAEACNMVLGEEVRCLQYHPFQRGIVSIMVAAGGIYLHV